MGAILKITLGLVLGSAVSLQAGASLVKAAIKGNLESVKQCLAAGESVNEADKYGWTPLMWGVYYQHLPVTEFLLERGADPNLQTTAKYSSFPAGTTALHLGAYYGKDELVATLVKKGAKTDLRDANGKSALDFALQYNFTTVRDIISKRSYPVGSAKAEVAKTTSRSEFSEAFLAGDRKRILKDMAERLSSSHPNDPYILAESGRAFLTGLETTKGRETLAAAEEQGLKDGLALRLIGLAWLKNGNKAEALAAYDKVLQRDPGNQAVMVRCAVDLVEVGLLSEAEKFMKSIQARDPNAWEAFLEFGRAYLFGGQRKQAATWFSRALEANPREDKVLLEILRAFADSQALM
ncbi:MAG: ankyrin repeat domain-containing protein [Holophaga sp.]|nr:ankyrin repeat domain-containing protein [Holophaga sp.]